MSMTNFAAQTSEQKTAWSLSFWKQARNLAFINKFLGKGANSLIQHITELKQTEKGARAVITLLTDMEGDGVVGDSTLEVIADNWRRAKSMERDAMARLTGAIIASAVQGQPEATIAERAGVNRMTVRKALGK